jgi:hypothetical protein
MGRLANAKRDFDRTLELAPTDVTALFERARLWRAQGQPDAARHDLLEAERALRAQPRHARSWSAPWPSTPMIPTCACAWSRHLRQSDVTLLWNRAASKSISGPCIPLIYANRRE